MSDRDDFTAPTKRKLAQRVGWRCSNPACRKVWLNEMERGNYRCAKRAYAWSLYNRGASAEKQASLAVPGRTKPQKKMIPSLAGSCYYSFLECNPNFR